MLENVEREIKKGDFISILKWNSHTDYSYVGDVLWVAVVDLPFIIVHRKSRYQKPDSNPDVITLDVRRIDIKLLSDEYVEGYANAVKQTAE